MSGTLLAIHSKVASSITHLKVSNTLTPRPSKPMTVIITVMDGRLLLCIEAVLTSPADTHLVAGLLL